jgi:hypothetical protein
MEKYILPKAPFERREIYVRGNVEKTAVLGRNDEGYLYGYIEHHELIKGLVARDVPVSQGNTFDEYGVNRPAQTYWQTNLYSNGIFIMTLEGSQRHMDTSHPDMAIFGAIYGEGILYSMFNGEIRCLEGYDTQPLFRFNPSSGIWERIPDTDYDTTLTVSGDVVQRQLAYKSHVLPKEGVANETEL